jgi:hypothetical protein
MDENNDENNEIRKFLEDHVKRVERIVQTRFNAVMDQVNKLANDNQVMTARVFNLEKVIRSQSAANYYIAADLQFLRNELDCLENYLSESDSALKAILNNSYLTPPSNDPQPPTTK